MQDYQSQRFSELEVQKFLVDFEFPLAFSRNVFDPSNRTLIEIVCRLEPLRRHRAVVLIDSGVIEKCPQLSADIAAYTAHHHRHIELISEPLSIAGGERCKNDPANLQLISAWLKDNNVDRQSFLIAIGGGALLDLAGFAAATVHRGVRLIRLPTTVLAQNDSGMGVKNGINAFGLKNFLGCFAPPFGVLVDFDFLQTLSARDCRAGLAEAVKVAAIRDADFFGWLEAHAEQLSSHTTDAMENAIRRCAALHLRQICHGGDPFEFGSARPLDFGHWAAHKLEAMSNYTVRHGEAVAIGMALDSYYAAEIGLLSTAEAYRLYTLLHSLGFRLWHEALNIRDGLGRRLLLQGLGEFREHLGGEMCLTLLDGIGSGVEVNSIDNGAVERALQKLKKMDA